MQQAMGSVLKTVSGYLWPTTKPDTGCLWSPITPDSNRVHELKRKRPDSEYELESNKFAKLSDSDRRTVTVISAENQEARLIDLLRNLIEKMIRMLKRKLKRSLESMVHTLSMTILIMSPIYILLVGMGC